MMTTNIKTSPIDIAKRQKINLTPGNTVKVYQKIQEKNKTRLQVFEGLIIARKHGEEAGATFTVRKVASGVGMEKTFPLYSPMIDKIEVVKRSKVRRSKLYYIRDKAAKEIRRRMKQILGGKIEEAEEEIVPEVVETPTEEASIDTPAEVVEETSDDTK